ncbi:MAG: recombinase family protein, partial [Faecousia sp.]
MARKSRVHISEMPEMLIEDDCRAGQYGRLSVEDGDDSDQNSIGNQKKICINFLEQHPEIHLVDTYSDNGFTGMNYNRPGFKRMLHDLQTGRINCVIVKDISRLGRHFVMTSEFVEHMFPDMGVRLICVNDEYDSAAEHADVSSLTLPLKMVMNDYYVKDISYKIRSSIDAKMAGGEYIPSASSIPYGYLRNPDLLTFDVDPETAPVVQRIYQMRLERASFNSIARLLNEEEIPSPGRIRFLRGITTNKKYETTLWSRKTIRKILSDPVYIGCRIHGRIKRDKVGQKKTHRAQEDWQIIENAHPQIISKELFDFVQQINQEELEYRSGFEERAGFDTDYRDLFRGRVFCAECGSIMSSAKGCARPEAKTPSRIFFDCNGYRYSAHAKCSSHYVRQETLMQTVTDTLNQQIQIAVDLEHLADEIQKMPKVVAHQTSVEARHRIISQKRRNLEEKMEQLLVDLTQRMIDRSEYEYMKTRYSQQYEELLEDEAQTGAEMRSLEHAVNTSRGWIKMIQTYQGLPEVNGDILDALIKR